MQMESNSLQPIVLIDQSDSRNRTTEHPQHRGAPDLIPRRQVRELHLYEIEAVLNAVEVAAELIGLAQGKAFFVRRHAAGPQRLAHLAIEVY